MVSLFLIANFSAITAKADYNWIENNSFEDAATFIMNGDFEAGNSSWTFESVSCVIDTDAHGGNLHAAIGNLGYGINQDLSTNVTAGDVISLNFYGKRIVASTHNARLDVYYQNSTHVWLEMYDNYMTDDWTYYSYDLSEIKEQGGEDAVIYHIDFTHAQGATWIYLDDVMLVVEGMGSGSGQTTIEEDTEPWYTIWYTLYEENYVGITDTEAYDGLFSGYLTRINQDRTSLIAMYQDVNWLLSNNLTAITCYAKTDSTSNVIVRAQIYYADGLTAFTTSSATPLNDTSGWTLISFPLFYVETGKLIIRFGFDIISGDYGDFTYLDYIYLNATTEPTTQGRFSWYTVPETTKISERHFGGSVETYYTFYGSWFDNDGNATDSGTFKVSSKTGYYEGTISYGSFSFVINPRDASYKWTTEAFTITLYIDGAGVYEFVILASWNYTPDYPEPTPTPELQGYPAQDLMRFWALFMVFFVPTTIMGLIAGKTGVLIGLTTGCCIAVVANLIPQWFVILIAVLLFIVLYDKFVGKYPQVGGTPQ